ncbi:MAG: CHAT domain-containing protein [Acetobacteraceae bacterium]|nr:CHAT domain-containing protein [Acetobacteraceae bacterium]
MATASAHAAPSSGSPAPTLHERVAIREQADTDPDGMADFAAVSAMIVESRTDKTATVEDKVQLQMMLAVAWSHRQDQRETLRALEDGLAMLDKAGMGDGAMAIKMRMEKADTAGEGGDRDTAARELEQVLVMQTNLLGPSHSDVGETRCAIAYNAIRQGRLGYGIDQMHAGLQLMQPNTENRASWIANHNALASALTSDGRIEEALAETRIAAALAEKYLPPQHRGVGITLSNLAAALNVAGRFGEAELVARRALDLDLKYRGKGHIDTAGSMRTLSISLAGQDHATEAEVVLMAAAEIYRSAGDTVAPRTPAVMLLDAASMARGRGDDAAADARTREALALLTKRLKGDEIIEARALAGSALGQLNAGQAAAALPLIDAAVAGFATLPAAHPQRADAEILRGLVLVRLGRAGEGYAAAKPAAAAIEVALLDSAAPRGELINLAPAYARSFARIAAIALAAGDVDAGFRGVQLANLSELAIANSAVAARAAAGNPAVTALARAVQDGGVRRARLDRERSFALGKSAAEVSRLDAAIAALDVKNARARADLDKRFPEYRALSRPTPVGLAEVARGLGTEQALLLPLTVDDGLVSIVVTRAGLRWQRSAMGSAAIAAAVDSLRAATDAGNDDTAAFPAASAFALYQALLPAQLRAALPRHADLSLYGGGALSRLPLGMLLTAPPRGATLAAKDFARAPWLIRQHSIEVASMLTPSTNAVGNGGVHSLSFAGIGAPTLAPMPAIALAMAGTRKVRLLRGGLADPAALRALPSLPEAAKELRAIGLALQPTQKLLLLGDDATETRVKATDLSQYRVIAFATHGLVGGEGAVPEAALLLTPPATATPLDDGILMASEISALRLDADWVILSGCDSAGAGNGAAPTYSGLARSFFQAGSRSLLVSMWPIRDDFAARLTVATLAASRHLSKARALQRAELAMIADQKLPGSANPSAWASFILLER